MILEGDVPGRFTWLCLREAGADERAFKHFMDATFKMAESCTATVALAFADGTTRSVTLTPGRPRTTHIAITTDPGPGADRIRAALVRYAPEADPEARFDREVRSAWDAVDAALAPTRLRLSDLVNGRVPPTPQAADILMTHYERAPDESLLVALGRSARLPKSARLKIARWVVDRFRDERFKHDRWRMADVLWSLKVPEAGDAMIDLLLERAYAEDRQMLCPALAAIKHPRAAEALAAVLDDETVQGPALAALGTLKAVDQADRVRPLLRSGRSGIKRAARLALKRMGQPVAPVPPPTHLVKKGRPPRGLEEWSTNLDMDDLSTSLEKFAAHIESGFGPAEITEIVAVVEGTPIDRTRVFRFPIRFAGNDAELWVSVFMDDVDSPDLAVFGPPPLIQSIPS